MRRIYQQRKGLLALAMIALFAVSTQVTFGATTPGTAPAPLLKPTGVRLEYLGRDNYGFNYRVYVVIKNEGGAMTPNNTTTTPALMLNINESSGSGNTAIKVPMLAAGAEVVAEYIANSPITAFAYAPTSTPAPTVGAYKGLPGASLVIPPTLPYLYVTAGVMRDAQWSYDYSQYKTITKTFEVKTDGKAVESAPDFRIAEVKITPVTTGTNPGQRFNAEVKVVNAGGPFYHVYTLKGYPNNPGVSASAITEANLIVGLRVTDRNKVQTGYLGQVRGPIIKAGYTETLKFLLPTTAREMSGYTVKAMVNYGFRNNFGYPVIAGQINNSVKTGIDQQPDATNPFLRYYESNYANNYWNGYPLITTLKPDFAVSNPRVLFVKENFPLLTNNTTLPKSFDCYSGQLRGDLDHDGKITMIDVKIMEQVYLGVIKPTNMCCVDFDGNSTADISDYQKVINANLGITTTGNCAITDTQAKPSVFSSAFSCYPGQLQGDLDHDGKITVIDSVMMNQSYLGVLKPTNMCCVDFDGNGKTDINEVQKVTNASLGLTTMGKCGMAVSQPKYFAVANVVNQGAPIYIGSSSVRVAFRINFTVNNKASSTNVLGTLTSKTGWLNKGAVGEGKADVTAIFKKYPNYKITKNIVKVDAATVIDTSKGSYIETNDLNNTAVSYK